MSLYATDTIRRGQSGLGAFPVVDQADISVGYVVEASLAALVALPAWRRRSKMVGFAIIENKEYQLQSDLTTWVDVTINVPANVVTEDEIFDADGYILNSRIRNLYVNDSFVVANEAAMLALTTVTGNVIVRTDTGQVFFKMNNDDPSDLADFADITADTGAVTSVNGQTGAVSITIANLLAVGANVTAFDNQVAISPSVSSNTSAISTLQAGLITTDSNVSSLETYVESHLGLQALSAIAQNPTGAQINYTLIWNGTQFTLAPVSAVGGGATNFTGLGDVPNTYGTHGSKLVKVKADETGLEFVSDSVYERIADKETGSSLTDSTTKYPSSHTVLSVINSLAEGLKWKQSVRVATTANITLSGTQTIDGVSVIVGNRVLVKNQITQTENGIYLCAAGAWTRATDANISAELENAIVPVEEGTSNADTTWRQTADSITLGSSNIIFVGFGAAIPDASSSVKGIAKLYSNLAAKNTDGGITQSALVDAIQQPDVSAATASGTATYTASLAPAITAYTANLRVFIKMTNGNTGASTLNLNSLGAIPIKKNSIDALAAGDIVAGQVVELVYDGTNFQALGLTKLIETQIGNFTQDSVTLSIYKVSNFGTP